MGGLTFEKLLVIAVIAAFIVGPDRLPAAASGLAKLVKRAKAWINDSGKRLGDEYGEGFNIDELKKFDPRKYDPRRIIVQAWFDEDSADENGPAKRPPSAAAARSLARSAGIDVPYDTEAT